MSSLIYTLLTIQTLVLAFILHRQYITGKQNLMKSRHQIHQDPKPYIILAKDGMDVTFRNPNVPMNAADEALSYKARINRIKSCLPYLREYDEPVKEENYGLMEEMPSYIPIFKEKNNMVDMKFTIKEYKNKIARDWNDYNPIKKLGYYTEKVAEEAYDDIPGEGPDFKMPNLGIYNDPNYCHLHDSFLIRHPEMALDKMYFLTDYHPFSIPRWYGLGHYGLDTAPKVSKNMKRLNWYQRLHPVDPRTSVIYTKKANFHTYHEIGRHMACWGQAYNHIPGHGSMIRKDLLVTSANEYLAKHRAAGKTQCFNETSYFPRSYRLYEEEECHMYFDLIQSEEYKEDKKQSEI